MADSDVRMILWGTGGGADGKNENDFHFIRNVTYNKIIHDGYTSELHFNPQLESRQTLP